ncbi:methyltransferase-like protein 7A [Megalops cyprinoides]|uniref:methyltransferase-like protein 7A n=1 Tax=Megalops cyprinoides TaxID=118141 RepID=UPI0018651570|nr:methyltransferase-like protein 7A [Megalops cyprinoides]
MAVIMTLFTLLFKVLSLPLQLMEFVGIYSLYKRVFPFMVYKISINYNKKMHFKKKELFSNLSEFAGPDGRLKLLEIGCGSGANFEYYPSGCKIICTDPNPHFETYLQKSLAANDHLVFEKFIVASGEDLGAVRDNSVDVVVCTLVLCSVNNTKRVLEEAHRLLRPGGALYFMEHVVSDPSTWTHFFQHVLQPLWYYFGDGCEVTRMTWKDLEASKFSDLKLRHIEAPLIFIIKPHILGYAVK